MLREGKVLSHMLPCSLGCSPELPELSLACRNIQKQNPAALIYNHSKAYLTLYGGFGNRIEKGGCGKGKKVPCRELAAFARLCCCKNRGFNIFCHSENHPQDACKIEKNCKFRKSCEKKFQKNRFCAAHHKRRAKSVLDRKSTRLNSSHMS